MLHVQHEASRASREPSFPYQTETVEAIKKLTFAAIFHEQGLGKTKIAIDLALTWLQEEVVDSVLFVTKKGLIANWDEEIRHHSYMRARVLGQDRRANFFAFNSPARFYLTHYEVCKAEAGRLDLFLKTRRVAVICDEAQKLKNPTGALAQTMFKLAPGFVRRVIMTGTPIANRPYDIWSLIYFLDQGNALGPDFAEFRRHYDLAREILDDPVEREEFENRLGGLTGKLAEFCVRETKQSAGIALPDKTIRSEWGKASGDQIRLYAKLRDELKAEVWRDGNWVVDDVEDVLKRLLRLVQVASNPRLVDESYDEIPAKLPMLRGILDPLLKDASQKCIVWTSFTENAEWLSSELGEFGAVRVHGKLSIDERNAALKKFKTKADCRILVATPGAAKEGLTLTVANHAIFFDRSFSLDDYLQAQDRIHRISQQRACVVHNLLLHDTVDEWVDELLGAKHLAAKLGLGDISADAYKKDATYRFLDVLEQILGTPNRKVTDAGKRL